MSSPTLLSGLESTLLETIYSSIDKSLDTYDVVIQFLSAEVTSLVLFVYVYVYTAEVFFLF